MLTFNAIDVETANPDRASICQIGIVHVVEGKIDGCWQTLINPKDWFDEENVLIHGIDEKDVKNCPTLPEVRGELRKRLRGSVVVSHTSFDRVAFERAMTLWNLEQLQVTWLDSAKIVRRAWPEQFGRKGYNLKNVAAVLGIQFTHHDALEDARACAEIVLCACAETGNDIDRWLRRADLPIAPRVPSSASPSVSSSVKREGSPDGVLFGETIVFTGDISGCSRQEAADMAAEAGCNVVTNISKKVTILVLGTQDMKKLKGKCKSNKHRKTEELVAKGAEIQIISGRDFLELMRVSRT